MATSSDYDKWPQLFAAEAIQNLAKHDGTINLSPNTIANENRVRQVATHLSSLPNSPRSNMAEIESIIIKDGNCVTAQGWKLLGSALMASASSSLSSVFISHINQRTKDVVTDVVCNLLDSCSSLKVLSLANCQLSPLHAQQLSESIATNQSLPLQRLDLSNNPIGNNGVASLADAIRQNGAATRLKYLGLASVEMTRIGAVALANCLRKNKSLRRLDIRYNCIYEDGQVNPFTNVLERHNVTLNFLNHISTIMLAKNRYCLKLNQSGRKHISAHDGSMKLWHYVLHKRSKDVNVLYYFVRSRPDVFQH